MNEGALRGLKVAVVGMGVLIVVGVVGLAAAVSYRSASRGSTVASPPLPVAPGGQALADQVLTDQGLADLTLDEPASTRIVTVGQADGRISLLLQGGGPDRVVVVNARTNQVLQRIRLAR